MTMNDNYPELLADLAARVTETLVGEGLDAQRATEIGFKTAESVRRHWGGQQVYIPIGTEFEISQRDQAMWQAFNGHNHEDLARQYQVSLVHVYRVVKRMQAVARARTQGDLFKGATVVSSAPPATTP